MDFQAVFAILELIGYALRRGGKLARFSHDDDTRAEFICEGGSHDEAPRLNAKDGVYVPIDVAMGDEVYRHLKGFRVSEKGRNVLEEDPFFGKVCYIPDFCFKVAVHLSFHLHLFSPPLMGSEDHELQRVHQSLIVSNFKVQVRARRPACLPHLSDNISLPHHPPNLR